MDSQLFVEYEIVDANHKSFITESRDEAADYFLQGWLVFETHRTVVKVSKFTSSTQSVTTVWNGNPKIERELKNDQS